MQETNITVTNNATAKSSLRILMSLLSTFGSIKHRTTAKNNNALTQCLENGSDRQTANPSKLKISNVIVLPLFIKFCIFSYASPMYYTMLFALFIFNFAYFYLIECIINFCYVMIFPNSI